jgi:hypothetical protein
MECATAIIRTIGATDCGVVDCAKFPCFFARSIADDDRGNSLRKGMQRRIPFGAAPCSALGNHVSATAMT